MDWLFLRNEGEFATLQRSFGHTKGPVRSGSRQLARNGQRWVSFHLGIVAKRTVLSGLDRPALILFACDYQRPFQRSLAHSPRPQLLNCEPSTVLPSRYSNLRSRPSGPRV